MLLNFLKCQHIGAHFYQTFGDSSLRKTYASTVEDSRISFYVEYLKALGNLEVKNHYTMNVCIKLHGNPSHSRRDISVWIKPSDAANPLQCRTNRSQRSLQLRYYLFVHNSVNCLFCKTCPLCTFKVSDPVPHCAKLQPGWSEKPEGPNTNIWCVFLSVLMPAGGELLPGHESDRCPAAHVHERRGRLLGSVTAADQSEACNAR